MTELANTSIAVSKEISFANRIMITDFWSPNSTKISRQKERAGNEGQENDYM